MKKLIPYSLILVLLGCQNGVDPASILYFKFFINWGLTGKVSTLNITPTIQTYNSDLNGSKTCKKSVSTAEWQELIDNFDYAAFKKQQEVKTVVCYDCGGSGLLVNIGGKEQYADLSFSNTDSIKLNHLFQLLGDRIAEQMQTCR